MRGLFLAYARKTTEYKRQILSKRNTHCIRSDDCLHENLKITHFLVRYPDYDCEFCRLRFRCSVVRAALLRQEKVRFFQITSEKRTSRITRLLP